MALVPAFKAEKNLSGASLRFAIGLFIIALIGLSLPLKAQAKGNPLYASVVMDAETGMILHQRYADRKLHPASLAKMMTLLMAFEAIDNGSITIEVRRRNDLPFCLFTHVSLAGLRGSRSKVSPRVLSGVQRARIQSNGKRVALCWHHRLRRVVL